jgi:sensor histidine kinase regulating citrate/malate metabolism
LSIYITKAKSQNIQVSHKIDLPATLHVNDNEMAILLSNLLENAINANLKQPVNDRKIRITVKNEKKQIVISIKNRFTGIVSFDKEGLPLTHLKGHGLGMRSLSLFKKNYNATVFCTHKGGWFSILIYTAQNKKG